MSEDIAEQIVLEDDSLYRRLDGVWCVATDRSGWVPDGFVAVPIAEGLMLDEIYRLRAEIGTLGELSLDCETERDMYRAEDGILPEGRNDEFRARLERSGAADELAARLTEGSENNG